MAKQEKDSKYGEKTILMGFRVPLSKQEEFRDKVNVLLEEYQFEYLKIKLNKK